MKKKLIDIHIRLDEETLEWFRSSGPGYQVRMRKVLEAHVRSHTPKAEVYLLDPISRAMNGVDYESVN